MLLIRPKLAGDRTKIHLIRTKFGVNRSKMLLIATKNIAFCQVWPKAAGLLSIMRTIQIKIY